MNATRRQAARLSHATPELLEHADQVAARMVAGTGYKEKPIRNHAT
jgi:hypothetical protein